MNEWIILLLKKIQIKSINTTTTTTAATKINGEKNRNWFKELNGVREKTQFLLHTTWVKIERISKNIMQIHYTEEWHHMRPSACDTNWNIFIFTYLMQDKQKIFHWNCFK